MLNSLLKVCFNTKKHKLLGIKYLRLWKTLLLVIHLFSRYCLLVTRLIGGLLNFDIEYLQQRQVNQTLYVTKHKSKRLATKVV